MGDILAECEHGMTADWCSICLEKGRNRSAAKNSRAWANAVDQSHFIATPWTHAEFESDCSCCGGGIVQGEVIGLRAGDWVCNDCAYNIDQQEGHPSQ